MPRSRSSGALSIVSNERNVFFGLCFESTFVIAAVSVVLPWSMCPIVPMFTCGFDRSNFSLPMTLSVFPISKIQLPKIPKGDAPCDTGLLVFTVFALHLGNDLFRDRAGRLFILLELHGIVSAALRGRPHVSGVTEHGAEWNRGPYGLCGADHLHTFDSSPPRIQIADDRTHIFLGDDNFDCHHRLQQNWLSLPGGFLKGHRPGDLECHFVRVDVVIAAVIEGNFDIHHLVSGKNTALHGILNALIDRLDVLLGDGAALNVVREIVAFSMLVGRDPDLCVTVVNRTTGLTG